MMPSALLCSSCGAANQPRARFCRSCGCAFQTGTQNIYNSTTGQLLPNILLKQRYRIIKSIGRGGFGAVYLAEDTQLGNRQVALKEMSQAGLNPQEQKDTAEAFRQEAIILARLHHPNLPSIFDHFEENQRCYLVMSFIEGEMLEDYLSKHQDGKLSLNEAIEVGTQLCTVLDYLHNRQPPIIFRDLKPANIMRASDGHIYLIDFGIARHFKPGQAKDTLVLGSPGYAAPEQYGKAQTTPHSDIYSLGATLHELISGHNPASSPFRFPPLQSLVPAVPATLATFITQMLDMDESKRPANVLLVKQALQSSRLNPVAPPLPRPQQNPAPSLPPPQPKSYSSTSSEPAGTLLFRYAERAGTIETLKWSPDGTSISITYSDKAIQVRSVDSNRQPSFSKDLGYFYEIQSMAWSPDGKRIASVAQDGTLQVWNADGSGQPLTFQIIYGASSTNNAVIAWSPDGTQIAFPSEEGTVRVVSLLTKQTITYESRSFWSKNSDFLSVWWSPDGQRIAAVSTDGIVRIWSPSGGRESFSHKAWFKSM